MLTEETMSRTEVSITFILKPSEKRALRILAAEVGMSVSDYLRSMLYEHTELHERARAIEARLHLDNRKR